MNVDLIQVENWHTGLLRDQRYLQDFQTGQV